VGNLGKELVLLEDTTSGKIRAGGRSRRGKDTEAQIPAAEGDGINNFMVGGEIVKAGANSLNEETRPNDKKRDQSS